MSRLTPSKITSPDGAALDDLCRELAGLSNESDIAGTWPSRQLELCGEYGVFAWFLSPEFGGLGWNDRDVVRGYLRLSAACLNTTFIITQRTGACRRIAMSDNERLKRELLADLVAGRTFATVGISHLTTSRRHLGSPVLRAVEDGPNLMIDGFCPWVTGGAYAQTVVLGATLGDGREVLVATPMDLPGITVPQPVQMVGLTASHTGEIRFDSVRVPRECLLAGPVSEVMKTGVGAKSGGLQTSTLALGLARAALDYVERERRKRAELADSADQLEQQWQAVHADLLAAAEGGAASNSQRLRTQANSLVLRASQAALIAAKGTGYVMGHPAAKFCREALFFLVWSCPKPVAEANLCELAGFEGSTSGSTSHR